MTPDDVPSATRHHMKKLTRADEIYAEEAGDIAVALERAECQVLLGRAALAEGDDEVGRRRLEEALKHLNDDAAHEVRTLLAAVEAGRKPPEPVVLKIGEFGRPTWEVAEVPQSASTPT
ncbi:hypothetical protein ACQPZF_33805 [Actinosynnema sp. CS-041913]|uniref:hypothetical protein n=1 Tax=Actinosynnema sp. CS-041913 TaxID=3239917 RepID=UPI003D931013